MEMQVDPRLRSNASSSTALARDGVSQSSYAANPSQHLPPTNLSPLSSDVPQQPYYQVPLAAAPQSPPSDANAVATSGNDVKRPRACESCRGLKVRCELNTNNPEGACKRCAKAGRECVVTAPSRKRQKKTDSRVAELEKKIDALTASLNATKSGAQRHESDSGDDSLEDGVAQHGGSIDQTKVLRDLPPVQSPTQRIPRGGIETSEWLRAPDGLPRTASQGASARKAPGLTSSLVGQKRTHSGEAHTNSTTAASPEARTTTAVGVERSSVREEGPNMYSFLIPKGAKTRTLNSIPTPESTASSYGNYEYSDVVDRRVLSSELAANIFDHYVKNMTPHFPAVVFPPGTTAAEIRRTKPTLFLAILSAGSYVINNPDIQRSLMKEIMRVYAERIICNGEKTLELIQSLNVSTLWYWPPEHFEELKFYQLVHISAIMAIDVGMSRRMKPMKHWRIGPGMCSRKNTFPNPETPEARRAWLCCYFTACNVSQSLRRPNLIKWTSYMQDCIDYLESSPEALPSDKVLCQLVRGQRIAEDVAVQFSIDDPPASVVISNPKVQYTLKGFERQFEEWTAHIPKDVDSPALKLFIHTTNLFIHEISIHIDHDGDDFKPPFIEATLSRGSSKGETGLLTSARISALSTCIASIHDCFNIIISFDVATMRCLPIYIFVRMAYAVVGLIKMYLAASVPNSEMGKIFKKEEMKVEYYLNALLDSLRATAEEDKFKPAAKFCMVLLMLKTWFQKLRDGKTGGGILNKDICVGAKIAKVFSAGMGFGGDCPGRAGGLSGTKGDSTFPDTPRQGSAYRQILSNDEGTPLPIKDGELNQQHGSAENGQGHSGYGAANTPLQLLSEVAMGNSNGVTESPIPGRGPFSNYQWMNVNSNADGATAQPPGGGSYGTPAAAATGAEGATPMADRTVQTLPGTDTGDQGGALDAMVGDGFGGFEQAMGFPDGDFASFMNDGFLNAVLDGAPNIFDSWD